MSDTNPNPPRAKKPTKTQSLEIELKAARARIQELDAALAVKNDILRRRDDSDRLATQDLEASRKKISELLAALRPFHLKTVEWGDNWPSDGISLQRKLTYGHLRHARDTYKAHA